MTYRNLVINDEYKNLKGFIEALPDEFNARGEIFYSGRNTIKTFDEKGLKLNVKSFKKPIFINQIIYGNIRKSKAKRSFLYATLLKNRGFHTPDPVGYIEQKRGKLLTDSFYVSIHEEFDGMMRELLHGSVQEHYELLCQFAHYTAALHSQKVLHLDFSSGNILYKKNNNKFLFFLVDLNRMEFDKPISLEKGCFNLRRLWGSDEMICLIAKEYAKARNLNEKICVRKTLEYRKKFWDNYRRRYPDATPYLG